MKHLFIYLISIYQRTLSPMLGMRCRFHPSCSEYSKQSFQQFGFFRGGLKTMVRLSKCHPFHPGGVDEVKA